ncbi:hypothetical protein G163CM_34740 [Pseudocitrobacter corydidari]|uniref:Uncharacterized protein n=1 Tax=Pseudocitrobacter corydidari TaxID=2891570 RepID=A0ABY3S7Y7_9ENTR|nr:hypothetical protein G163CM_34740 [Pseudocitrobacter corydidari]
MWPLCCGTLLKDSFIIDLKWRFIHGEYLLGKYYFINNGVIFSKCFSPPRPLGVKKASPNRDGGSFILIL